jgi:hypothetical protein
MPRDPFIREKFTTERTAARKLAAEYFNTRSWSERGPAILTVSVVQPFPIAIGSHLEGLEPE